MQSDAFKYNCYLDVYHPDMERLPVIVTRDPDPFGLRTYVTQLVILQLIIYLLVSSVEVFTQFRRKHLIMWGRGSAKLYWLRNLTVLLMLSTAVLIIIKAIFFKDQGDHLLASFIALVIYISSFSQIRRSAIDQGMTARIPGSKKYSRSPLNEDEKQLIVDKLNALMLHDKAFRDNLVSLPSVSRRLSVPPHHLSQVINEKLGQSFFEMIADYRIRDAARILKDPQQSHVTIEEISEEVGYNSKSAFNKAFKQIMGKTPSEYRDGN
jgi:AraC-like DNA-binding protein